MFACLLELVYVTMCLSPVVEFFLRMIRVDALTFNSCSCCSLPSKQLDGYGSTSFTFFLKHVAELQKYLILLSVTAAEGCTALMDQWQGTVHSISIEQSCSCLQDSTHSPIVRPKLYAWVSTRFLNCKTR
jgi:hypothetical protein